MFCTNCGNQLSDTAKFCTACGQKLDNAAPVPAPAAEPELPVNSPIVQNSLDPIQVPVEQEPEIPYAQESMEQEPIVQNALDPMVPPVEPEETLVYADTDPDLVEKKKPKKMKKGLLIGIIAGGVAVVAAVAIFLAVSLTNKANLYAQAMDLMGQKNYAEAMAIFEELGGYKESEVLLEDLQDKQEAYEEAVALLNERKFDEAMEAFQDLGDYADCADQAAFNVNYQKARYMMESAGNGDMGALSLIIPDGSAVDRDAAPIMLYEAAGELFLSLGEYSDAPQLAVQCYYGAGQIHLGRGNWESALAYMEMMDEANANAFYEEYLTYCSDSSALEDMKTLMVKLAEMDDPAASNELELAMLEPYVDAHFADETLKELIMKYLDAVYVQKGVLDKLNQLEGYREYICAAAQCSEVIDTLQEGYNFLGDDAELIEAHVGYADICWAYYHIYGMLHDSLDGQDAFTAKGMYFVHMENNTEYDGTLIYSITLRKNGKIVHETEEMRVDFTAGERATVPLGVQVGDVDFDQWNITYHGLESIKKDGTLLAHQD